ncbi:uncharacterized protein METZ01_LOCUS263099 [marine metagenome]|uniref:Uncharacterized protein n=1 Tax=marine metagenome TaxID=408172 RepID=A0A382JF46_9ZZZZ
MNYLLDLINVIQDTTSQWRVLDLTINLREKNLQAGID